MHVRFVFVFCKMHLSFATSMAHLFLSAYWESFEVCNPTHAFTRSSGGDLPWEPWTWWGSPSWDWGSPARCHHLTKQQAAVLQTNQKGNKSVLGKVQGSSRSFFRLLSLPHSLLRAKQSTGTKWVFISCQTQNWCVIYPSQANPAKNDRFPPSSRAEHVPWAEHQGFCS